MVAMLPLEIPLNIRPNATAGFAIAPVTVKVPAANTHIGTANQIIPVCLLLISEAIRNTKPAVATTSPAKIETSTWLPSVIGEMVFCQSASPAAMPKNAPSN